MTKSWENKTLLVVEDDKVSTELLFEVLSFTKAKTIYVTNGEDAVEVCKKEIIDAILMDIHLPMMSGVTALREIRKFNKDVIIIAQTAFAISGDKEKYLDQGFNDYISKPIFPKDLIELLAKYFD